MIWIRKSPFTRHEDPIYHMVELLSKEAQAGGTPFSEDEKSILAREVVPGGLIPEELQVKAKKLIEQLLEKEERSGEPSDPKSFGNSLEWAGDPDYPNIVALTEQVVCSGATTKNLPRLHGWSWIKDRVGLIGCAISIVLVMFLVVVIASIVFRSK